MKSSFSSTGKRYSVATISLVVGLAILTSVVPVNAAAAVTLDEAVEGQQILCRVMGSQSEPPVTRTSADGRTYVQVTCHGSLLDGATCDIVPGTDANGTVTSTCYVAGIVEEIHVAPGAGFVDASDPAAGGPDDVGGISVEPVVAEDPTRGEPAISPGFSVDEIVKALTDGCRHLGSADAEITRPEADAPPGSIGVRCVGGPQYDLHCTVAVQSLTCRWLEPVVKPTAKVVVTDINVVDVAPTPSLAEQADTPVPPTPTPLMDNDSGEDPTPAPTFTAPGNVGGNRAPTGDSAENPTQAEPTPTAGPIR